MLKDRAPCPLRSCRLPEIPPDAAAMCLGAAMTYSCATLDAASWQLERRSDGAVLVRVRSRGDESHRPPDAVFAFCMGDPQYLYWDERLRAAEIGNG